MKKTLAAMAAVLFMASSAYAADVQTGRQSRRHHMTKAMSMGSALRHQPGKSGAKDPRISLNLPAPMRRKQLSMMRGHLKAVDDIIALVAEGKFDAASRVAHGRLGLTPEMKKMCDMFENDDFREMGLAFHQRADRLGDTLKTGDMKQSLRALRVMLNSCVQCHDTFRQ